MTKIATTFAKVVEATEARVKGREGYVYKAPDHQVSTEAWGPTCFYVHTNTDALRTPLEAGCLAGCVLNDLGVSLESLKAMESNPAGDLVTEFLELPEHEVNRVARFLNAAQYRQDCGSTWGDSLELAKQAAAMPAPTL